MNKVEEYTDITDATDHTDSYFDRVKRAGSGIRVIRSIRVIRDSARYRRNTLTSRVQRNTRVSSSVEQYVITSQYVNVHSS